MVAISKILSSTALFASYVAASPTPGGSYNYPTQDCDRSYYFKAYCPGQQFHGQHIDACSGYGLCIGRQPRAVCPPNSYNCGSYTSYNVDTSRGLSLDVSCHGGQRAYVQSNGECSYYQSGYSGSYSSYNCGNWNLGPKVDDGYRLLTISKTFLACPVYGDDNYSRASYWRVAVGVPDLRNFGTCQVDRCVKFEVHAYENSYDSHSYTKAISYY